MSLTPTMSLYIAKTPDDFYRIIREQYRHFDMHTENMQRKLETMKRHLIKEMPSTRFLDYSFATDYIKQCKYYYKISCKDCIFHIISVSKPILSKIRKTVNDVILIKHLYGIQKPLEYFVILNPKKRFFPKKCCMQSKHINGGFTNPHSNKIYIIRKQEYLKVMIHELLHHNTRIHKDDWHPANIRKLKEHFNIHDACKFYPNEAVIETFACMIHTCLVAIATGKDFKKLLKNEEKHSSSLANKIIRMQNKKKWYEETNSYCYIILRNIFFCSFADFVKMYDEKALTDMLIMHKIPMNTTEIRTLRLCHSEIH